MKIERENFCRWMREAAERGLFEAHWNEVGEDRERIELEPDFKRFMALENVGMLASFTVRDEGGALVGYAMMMLAPNMLYKSHKFCSCVAIYIDPVHRGHGLDLVRLIEREMRGHVSKIFFGAKKGSAFGAVLEGLGYGLSETSFGKLLI